MKEILQRVRHVQRWLLLLRFFENTIRLLFYSTCAFALVALVDKLVYLNVDLYKVFYGCLAAPIPFALAALLFARITLLKAAILADERMHSKERLSSVIALPAIATPMEQALLDDAQLAVRKLEVVDSFPPTFPREARWFFAPAAVVCVSLLLLPQLDVFGWKAVASVQQKKVVEAKKQAEKIEKKAQEIREKLKGDEKELKELDRSLKDMEKLAQEIKNEAADKKETMAKLNNLADQLKKRQQEAAEKGGRKNDLKKELAKNLDNDAAKTSELEKALKDGDMEKASKELDKMMDKLQKGNLSKEEAKKMSDQLDRLAKAAEKNPVLEQLAKDMKDASDALKKEDMEKSSKDKDYAKQKMDQVKNDFKEMNSGQEMSEAEQEMLEQMINEMEQQKDELAEGEGQCKKCGKKMEETGGT